MNGPVRLGALLLLSVAVPSASLAQRGSIVVLVRSSTTQGPLPDARVILTRPSAGDTSAITDTSGRHTFRGLRSGTYTIKATWKELVSHPATIQLADREQVEVEFTVGSPPPVVPQLPELQVSVPTAHRPLMLGFDERRALGVGQFLTREDIAARTGVLLGELLRAVRGVRVSCRSGTCVPYMQRAPAGCAPLFILDEIEVEPFQAVRLVSQDIEGIEVYQGLSQMPLELTNDSRQGRCGAVVVWTRRPGLKPPPP